jgi:hypothetical protein
MHPLLAEGLTDAAGFVAGALIAYAAAKMLGFDPLAASLDGNTIVGIVVAGIGGGAGVQLARRLRLSRRDKGK